MKTMTEMRKLSRDEITTKMLDGSKLYRETSEFLAQVYWDDIEYELNELWIFKNKWLEFKDSYDWLFLATIWRYKAVDDMNLDKIKEYYTELADECDTLQSMFNEYESIYCYDYDEQEARTDEHWYEIEQRIEHIVYHIIDYLRKCQYPNDEAVLDEVKYQMYEWNLDLYIDENDKVYNKVPEHMELI